MELVQSRSKRGTFLLPVDGFLYYKNGGVIGATAYWKFRRTTECNAPLVTVGNEKNLTIKKGTTGDRSHAPNPDEMEAEKIVSSLKRSAKEHPEAPPS